MKRSAALNLIGFFLFIFGFVSRAQAQTVKTEYTAFNLRDPFEKQLPGAVPVVKPPEIAPIKEKIVPPAIVVEGLVAGGPVPQVIIGGKIFRIGDKVQDAAITAITKEGIEVVYKLEMFSYPAPSRAMVIKREEENDK